MANRCTGGEVKNVITTAKTAAQVEFYITAANLIVTDAVGGESLSDATLKEIEIYLSAHMVSMDDPSIVREKTGDSEATYHGKSDMGLDFSPYGQMVKLLDPTGKLALRGRRPAKMEALF